ncbi:LPS translocon maturation chaperone LptM [Eleftheria terrae]|uniref:LPS translocon maturation chaperone LptM n=1 Tax=Eleftheria terrae TaxID=1597781 RepID=UPI00341C9538
MSKRAPILAAGLFTALALGLSACGQKGPLYLPGAAPRPAAPASAAAPAASAPAASTPASR